ncbi:salivary glue protein Sgs-3-like [Lineus longissimus]|uniref:salivary glue protein Sgs-3-like n=1 Tax=Lineus longissimus TaxID=88925 RepID=UPI00315D89A9
MTVGLPASRRTTTEGLQASDTTTGRPTANGLTENQEPSSSTNKHLQTKETTTMTVGLPASHRTTTEGLMPASDTTAAVAPSNGLTKTKEPSSSTTTVTTNKHLPTEETTTDRKATFSTTATPSTNAQTAERQSVRELTRTDMAAITSVPAAETDRYDEDYDVKPGYMYIALSFVGFMALTLTVLFICKIQRNCCKPPHYPP